MSEPLFEGLESLPKRFQMRFGSTPRLFCAPGRINIIGEHTDYSGGLVMPAAVDRWTVVAVAPNEGREITAASVSLGLEECGDLASLKPTGSWFDYVAGVAATLVQAGIDVPGTDLMIESNVPIGAGVSSSAAVEVATANALLSLTGRQVEGAAIAKWAQRAENQYVGAPCGIMDQFASANSVAGHALLLDCSSESFELLPLPQDTVFLLINSMVKHSIVEGEYGQRRADCEAAAKALGVPMLGMISEEALSGAVSLFTPRVFKRFRHVVTENDRTRRAAIAMQRGDVVGLGRLMNESHASLRDDMEVSTDEVNRLAEIAQGTRGVFGARLMGGGFGGCVIALVAVDEVENARQGIAQRYREVIGKVPDTYVCRTVDGAHEIFL